MPSTNKCEYCGATILSSDRECPQCGAPNPNYVEDMKRTVFLPKTIEELKEYCSERGMPLLRMRFFIGEDFKEPKAFGIYQDGNEFVVYKNKANGQRAVRYRGPDEEHAVNELFQKLLEECHNRGIYPDGKPEQGGVPVKQQPKNKIQKFIIIYFVAVAIAIGAGTVYSHIHHRNDGYYRIQDNTYYHYGDNWYVDSDYGWYELDEAPPLNMKITMLVMTMIRTGAELISKIRNTGKRSKKTILRVHQIMIPGIPVTPTGTLTGNLKLQLSILMKRCKLFDHNRYTAFFGERY